MRYLLLILLASPCFAQCDSLLCVKDSVIQTQHEKISFLRSAIDSRDKVSDVIRIEREQQDRKNSDYEGFLHREIKAMREEETKRSWVFFGAGAILTTAILLLIK